MNIAFRIIKKICQKTRLKEYENILLTAKANGYELCSIRNWLESDKKGKYFILRHDVDLDKVGARKMFEIEKRLGAKSTYYFRNSTKDFMLIKEMQSCAFEAGLHYESLADYAKINGIIDGSLLTEDDYTNCKYYLRQELIDWIDSFGDLHTICAHGDKRNRLLKVPNRILFDKELREEMCVYFDACDKDILDKVDIYISDTSVIHNHKWKQGISPKEAISRGDRTIMLLTHPTHWNYSFFKNIKVLYKGFIEDNLNYVYKKDRFI